MATAFQMLIKRVKQKRTEQESHDLNNYLSKSDWDTLEGPTSLDGKKRVVSKRFWSLGVTNPSEQTIKWEISLLVATHLMGYLKTLPSYRTIYELVLDLKGMVVSNHADARHAVHLVHYPNTATELDTARYRIAYPKEEDVPVPRQVDRMCQVANKHVPLRKNQSC